MPVIHERFQQVGDTLVHRAEHVWLNLKKQNRPGWKCVLCGAVTRKSPPVKPTPDEWLPDTFEPLTDSERNLCPEVSSY